MEVDTEALHCEKQLRLVSCLHPVDLQFSDLVYTVRDCRGRQRKPVLRNACGRFRPGRLSAILGPSGAGKTSLLNVLAGFRTTGVQGSIRTNGRERVLEDFRHLSCYIPQDFALLSLLSARETLAVAANLKLSSLIGDRVKQAVVTEVLQLLGLTHTGDTAVGNLSGGERKRLSIGIELLVNPPIMFFDEPTSGLDSSSSLQVMSHLRSLATAGRTVVCSVHQPNSRLVALLDDVLLLAEGRTLYCGTLDGLVPALESAGFPFPEFYNRADFAIEVASHDRGEDLDALVECARTTHLRDDLQTRCQDTPPQAGVAEDAHSLLHPCNPTNVVHSYHVSSFKQFRVLLHRSLTCTVRDTLATRIRLLAHVLVALLLGGMYYGIGNEASKVTSNTACLFFFILFLFFSNAMPTVQAFPSEAAVFMREHLNNWYCLPAYYMARTLADIPLQLLCPTCFLLIGYFMTDQPADASRFLMFWGLCMLLTVVAQTLGLVIGTLFDEKLGVFLVPASTIPMLLFSGFFMRLSDIPAGLSWLSYGSYFRYAFEAAMQAIYGYGRPNLICSMPYCRFKNPAEYLEELGMSQPSYATDMAALAFCVLVLQACFYGALRWRLWAAR